LPSLRRVYGEIARDEYTIDERDRDGGWRRLTFPSLETMTAYIDRRWPDDRTDRAAEEMARRPSSES
jgi:hypothetical protein